MSSKKAIKQAQKQAYAKHRSSITNSGRFNFKNKPELHILSGSVEENFKLKPKTFSASK